MYSGKEGIEYPTGWALNPMAYQHVPSEQVDWAALAQQWIQMKETCPPAAMSVTPQPPPPPPPPTISSSQNEAEGGEAPMDVEGGDADAPAPPVIPPHQWNTAMSGWDNTWNPQWAGNWGWQQNSSSTTKAPLMPTPDTPYQGYSTGDNNAPGYTSTNNASQSTYSGEYWSGDESNSETKSRPNRGNRYSPNRQGLGSRRGGIHLQRQNHLQMNNEVPDTTQTIDAAKRKQLPAWIREGLEKMEREKQKQIDREREKKEREEYLKMKKLEEEKSLQESQPDDGVPRLPAKSKFDSDSEKSDNEEKVMEREATKIDKTIKTQIHHVAPQPLLKRSQEEIMKDLMLNVRRTLTEILLEVTDDQIHNIAKEELSRVRSHSQASRGVSVASKLQGLSAIGGGLGLGIYGDSSDSESESEVDSRSGTPDKRQKEKSGDVTDSQLQETIRRRKAEFEKTSREIESRIAEEERLEQQRVRRDATIRTPPPQAQSSSGSSSPERERRHLKNGSDGESTTVNNRKEQNVNSYKKSSRDKDGISSTKDTSRRHTPEKSHKDEHVTSNKKNDKNHDSKKNKEKKYKNNNSNSSSSEDENSDSEDSLPNKNGSGSASEESSSSESSQKSSSKSESDSSYKRSKKKKRRSSNESVKDKKRKNKSKKQKSKHSEKETNRFESEDSRKKYYDESDSRISSRNSVLSPDRKSHKSKNRSRSRSYDRKSKKYDSYKYRDRSRDRSSYSREYRSRSRDRNDRSKKDHYRSRSRERRARYSRERRGRSREGRRDRRGESRSYYY